VLVLALADRVFVLERGAVVHQGPAKPLLDDDLADRKKFCDCRPQLAQGNGRPMAP
jgi:ABC-type glutathione transport system ATPase component